MEKQIDVGIQRVKIYQAANGQWYFFPVDVMNVRNGQNSAPHPTRLAAIVAAGLAWTRMCIVEFP